MWLRHGNGDSKETRKWEQSREKERTSTTSGEIMLYGTYFTVSTNSIAGTRQRSGRVPLHWLMVASERIAMHFGGHCLFGSKEEYFDGRIRSEMKVKGKDMAKHSTLVFLKCLTNDIILLSSQVYKMSLFLWLNLRCTGCGEEASTVVAPVVGWCFALSFTHGRRGRKRGEIKEMRGNVDKQLH